MKAKSVGVLIVAMLVLAAVGLQVGLAQVGDGDGEPFTVENGCVEDVANFGLNCTANDVQLATATLHDIEDPCEYPGDLVTFTAEFEVLLTAKERHDIGIYFATDGDDNGDGAISGTCSVSTIPYAPSTDWLDLDGTNDPRPGENKPSGIQDVCGDIDDPDYNPLYPLITITAVCDDPDGNGFLNLPYCTSWRQPGSNELCLGPLDAYPGAPSKCKCDMNFEVPVPVPPAELEVTKSADPTSVYEPGENVKFDVTVENTGIDPENSVTLTSLSDDIYRDITYVHNDIVSTDCSLATIPAGDVAGNPYTCSFTAAVTGNDGDSQTDTVTANGIDERGNDLTGSASATVTILDVSTPLQIVKSTESASTLPEPGGNYDFKVVVTNPSTFDSVTVSDLDDTYLADLQDNGSCEDEDSDTTAPWDLSPGEALTCYFTVNHTGAYPFSWTNKVYVTAVDEDNVGLSAYSNTQTVDLSDVSTPLQIVKSTESASTLPEPGGNYDFKVVVTNPSTFDSVTVSDLDDTYLADLQDNGSCEDEDGDTTAPWDLSPGEALTCYFTVNHTGDYPSSWTNKVYVTAADEDTVDLSAYSNTQTVDLSDVSTPLQIVKSTESASTLPEPGGNYDFKVVVTNPSAFDSVTVSDLDDTYLADLQDNGSCEDEDSDTTAPWDLSPGEALTCYFTVNHTGDYPSSWTNKVYVTAADEDTVDLSAYSNTQTVDLSNVPPEARLEKSVDKALVTFEVVVYNDSPSSSDPLTINSLDDDVYGDIADETNALIESTTCSVPQTIPFGGSYTCSFEAWVNSSPQTDKVIANVSDDDGNTIYPFDSATVTFE